MVLEMVEMAGIIVQSVSLWACPIMVVPKQTQPGDPHAEGCEFTT